MKLSQFLHKDSFLIPVITFVVLSLGIGAAGFIYYEHLEENFRALKRDELNTIADLKVDQISSWRKAYLGNAKHTAQNPLVSTAVAELLKNPSAGETKEKIRAWLSSIMTRDHYAEAVLYDADGTPRLWVGPSGAPPSDIHGFDMDEALLKGEAKLLDFHREEGTGHIHLTLLIPILDPEKDRNQNIGLFLFQISPSNFLYPTIQTWPTPSATGEILLVRREGEDILFLNELRHRKDTALTFRHPLASKNLPAAMAVRGEEGIIEGVDYRGVAVLAALRHIPESPWYLVVKVDSDEIYAPLLIQGQLVAVLVGSMMVTAAFILSLMWQRRQAFFEKKEQEARRNQTALTERFNYLSRHANDIILLVRPDGRIVEANNKAIQAYGYSGEQLLARSIRDLRAPETHPELDEQIRQVIEEDGVQFETRHMRSDGCIFPVEVSSRPIEIEGETYLQSIIRDITERKEAEKKIFHLNRIYALLSHINQAIIHIRDRDTLVKEACRIATTHGKFPVAWVAIVDCEESRFKPFAWSGIEEEDIPQVSFSSEGYGSSVSGSPETKGRAIICNNLAMDPGMNFRPADAAKYGCGSAAAIVIHMQGAIVGILCVYAAEPDFFDEQEVLLMEEIGMDLSFALETYDLEVQRAEAVEELRTSEANFKRLFQEFNALLDAIPDRLTLHSEDLKVIWGNREAGRFLNKKVSELIGRHCYEVWSNDPKPCERCPVARSFQTGEPHSDQIVSTDGRTWDCRTIPIKNEEGKIVSVVNLGRDITEHRRMETQLRQSQKMEAIGTLSGGIAHDFNNILGVIMGYTELSLFELPNDAHIRDNLQEVLRSAHRAKDLVGQILTFSRQREQEWNPVMLTPIVKEALKLLRASLPSTIEIRSKLACNGTVLADSTQIHQVLMNLCTNAAHAMREKGGLLEVNLSNEILDSTGLPSSPVDLKPGPYIMLTVRDTGHGIDPSIIDRIFDPFFTSKVLGEGTGLGLSVVHGIVKSHGGAIEVESRPGVGTTFTVFFPAMGGGAAAEAEPPKSLPLGSERILLVDDEPALLLVIKQMLKRLGYQVSATEGGIEALEAFRNQPSNSPFDLVITDMTMPRMTGTELALELFHMKPDVRVILCTGFSERISPKEAGAIGIHGFLLKPITIGNLAKLVREVLDGQTPS